MTTLSPCPACKREVEKLLEILIIEGDSRVQLLRCDDCLRIIEDRIAQMRKAEIN